MDSFNRVISFILGLVVVIVFLGVVTGRINLKNKFPFISRSVTTTPTPSPSVKNNLSPTPISTIKISNNNQNQNYNFYQTNSKTPKTIPATGSPTEILVLIPFLSGIGLFLRSTKSGNL